MQKNVRPRFPGRCLTTLLALITLAVTIARSAARNVATDDMDISIKPGDDFYRYANGGWLKTNTMSGGGVLNEVAHTLAWSVKLSLS